MRKYLLFVLFLLLLAVPAHAEAEDGRITVVTTIFPQYDFIREIAGDRVELTMLLAPGAEIHSFEPSPQDVIAIQKADVFAYVGGESDEWVQTILESAPSETRQDVSLMHLVGLDCGDEDHAHSHEHHEDGYDEYDEHVWTSPVYAMTIVEGLTDALCTADPANEAFYRENAAAYLDELHSLDEAFREVVSTASRSALVFGDRFPLTHFVREYGLEYSAAFPGCATETEPNAATIARLIGAIMEDRIPVVFCIELSNRQIATILSEQTGAEVMLFYTCHNVSSDDFDAGLGYLDMMKINVESLKKALN